MKQRGSDVKLFYRTIWSDLNLSVVTTAILTTAFLSRQDIKCISKARGCKSTESLCLSCQHIHAKPKYKRPQLGTSTFNSSRHHTLSRHWQGCRVTMQAVNQAKGYSVVLRGFLTIFNTWGRKDHATERHKEQQWVPDTKLVIVLGAEQRKESQAEWLLSQNASLVTALSLIWCQTCAQYKVR